MDRISESGWMERKVDGTTNGRIIISSTFFFQELSRGLQELLNYEGNVEEDMCQRFQVLALPYIITFLNWSTETTK